MEQVKSAEKNQYLYDQFEQCMYSAGIMRLLRATHVISELRERKTLLQYSGDDHQSENISTESEDSIAWERITASSELLNRMDLETVRKHLVQTYLRALRLVTDFLENDKSIPVASPEQNLNRALNRLILLEDLEKYLREKYKVDLYA